MFRKAILAWALGLSAVAAFAQQRPILIDTDAGSDDLMAIAFLLAQPSVRVEAITVANGLAHVDAGARNIARLMELAGRKDVPVFAGRNQPLQWQCRISGRMATHCGRTSRRNVAYGVPSAREAARRGLS